MSPYVNSEARSILVQKFPQGIAELEGFVETGDIAGQSSNILEYGVPGLTRLSQLVPSPMNQIFENLARHAENIGNELNQMDSENEADRRIAAYLVCHLLKYNAEEMNRGTVLTFD